MRVFISHSAGDRETADAATTLANVLESDGNVVHGIAETDFDTDADSIKDLIASDLMVLFASSASHNQWYELGIAHASGMPVIIAAKDAGVIPLPIRSAPYVLLTGEESRDTETIIRRLGEFDIDPQPAPGPQQSAESLLREMVATPETLLRLDPREFESLVADWFRERGYEVAPPPPGVDAFDFILRDSEHMFRFAVEAKKQRRQSQVSVETVRKLIAMLPFLGGAVGSLITSAGGFTSAAVGLAAASGLVLRTVTDLADSKVGEEFGDEAKDATPD